MFGLFDERRFVQPVVRDLDTGQTFSLSEVDKKIPKGVDPAVLEKVKPTALPLIISLTLPCHVILTQSIPMVVIIATNEESRYRCCDMSTILKVHSSFCMSLAITLSFPWITCSMVALNVFDRFIPIPLHISIMQ
jgi:hypothetical protein